MVNLTKVLLQLLLRHVIINPINTEEYVVKAKRPKNSKLSKKSLDESKFNRLPSWQDALVRYLKEIGAIK